jgi:ATP-dependent protease HslVU (ClpYQ) peptidase subunit
MTCVAWDGRRLAADKQSTQAGVKRTTTKIARHGSVLIGTAGEGALCQEMINWIRAGADPASIPPRQLTEDWVHVVMITPPGNVWFFARSATPTLFEDPIFAMGSGRDYALAAMYLGLTAEKAVAVACHFDADCGMGIDMLELEQPEAPAS